MNTEEYVWVLKEDWDNELCRGERTLVPDDEDEFSLSNMIPILKDAFGNWLYMSRKEWEIENGRFYKGNKEQ